MRPGAEASRLLGKIAGGLERIGELKGAAGRGSERMIFPFSFTSAALCWLFLMAFPLTYDKFRQEPDTTHRQALSAALGVTALLIVIALLLFSLLGFP